MGGRAGPLGAARGTEPRARGGRSRRDRGRPRRGPRGSAGVRGIRGCDFLWRGVRVLCYTRHRVSRAHLLSYVAHPLWHVPSGTCVVRGALGTWCLAVTVSPACASLGRSDAHPHLSEICELSTTHRPSPRSSRRFTVVSSSAPVQRGVSAAVGTRRECAEMRKKCVAWGAGASRTAQVLKTVERSCASVANRQHQQPSLPSDPADPPSRTSVEPQHAHHDAHAHEVFLKTAQAIRHACEIWTCTYLSSGTRLPLHSRSSSGVP